MKLKIGKTIATATLIAITTSPISFAGDKGGHAPAGAPAAPTHQDSHPISTNAPQPHTSDAPRPTDPAHPVSTNSSAPHVSESAHPTEPATPARTPWVDPGFQLALADAKAQYQQALAAATTPAEKKAARTQYLINVLAIRKAQSSVK
jgi:hypothetical protein